MNNIRLGPVVGDVSDKKAKVWFWGTVDPGGKIPFCHVFDKDKNAPVAGSPFKFKAISSSVFEEDVDPQQAFMTEISFPDQGDIFSYGIRYGEGDICREELIYRIKPFPADGDEPFSFGLISCHKPRAGQLHHISNMWGFMNEKLADHDASFLVQGGDQVYCDSDNYTVNAFKRSMDLIKNLDTLGDEEHRLMLNFYRQVYVDGWNFPEVKKVLAGFPQVMIWDDHEVEDGWGSRPEHFFARQQAVFRAAKEAYYEFQHSHNPRPLKQDKMYYAFHYGAAAFLVVDVRGERNIAEEQLMSEEQFTEIENWLKSDRVKESKILFLVSSVPVVHLSRGLLSFAKLFTWFLPDVKDDVADQWSWDHNKKARWRLLNLLADWSGADNKPVFILGGDVHVGTEACLRVDGSDTRFYQVTASPISNKPAKLLDKLSSPFSSKFRFKLNEEKTRFMDARIIKRYRKRNFAIIEVKYENGEPGVTLNMYQDGEDEPATTDLMTTCRDEL